VSALNIVTICGSLRKGSYNAALIRLLPSLAPTSFKFTAAPPIDGIPHYNSDLQNEKGFPAEVTAWADAIRGADGIIIASPEYNWTIPGTLKNAIDWVSRMKDQPFKGKPVALQSASIALLGGSRMQYHMRQCLVGIDALVFGRPEVLVTFANQKFDETTGEFKDQAGLDIIRQQLEAFEPFVRKISGKT
jgi:chromate reductase